EDPEPAERIDAFELLAHARGNRGTRHAVKAIAAGDVIAGDFLDAASRVMKAQLRQLGIEVEEAYVLDAEKELPAGIEPRLDQVTNHFVLRVHHDGAPAGELRK